MERIRRNKKAVLCFLMPGFLLYTVLLMVPIGGSLVMSFFKWNGIKNVPMVFVGFSNFKAVITDAMFLSLIHICHGCSCDLRQKEG